MTGNQSWPAAGDAAPSPDFRLLFEASPTPSLVVQPPEFTCVAVNDAYLRAAGMARKDVLGRTIFDLRSGNATDPQSTGVRGLEASLERVLVTGRADEMPVRKFCIASPDSKGGEAEERWWRTTNSPVPGAEGGVVAVIHQLQDVTETVRLGDGSDEPDWLVGNQLDTDRRLRETTAALERTEAALLESERRRAEAALRESEGKFRAITDLVPDLLWSSDASGSATWYNRRWTEYTGLSEEQSVGAGWVAAVHPEDREEILRAFQIAVVSGSALRHELRLRGVDAEYRWFLLEARPARDTSGQIAQWFGALTDVHEQRLALEAAKQASEAKSQFLAVMSHELRTPLSGVISFTDLLETGIYGPVSAQQQEALARIKANSWNLVSIIDEILTLTQTGTGRGEVKLEQTDVAELVQEVVRNLEPEAERRGLALRWESADGAAPVRTDPGKVRRILTNLVGNAIKYTEQGEVAVEVDHSTPGSVRIHVRDTGPGIAPEDHERIFQPFTQVDASLTRVEGGTGMGLAISRKLARLLDGDVTLQSSPGEGSTFTLHLPSTPTWES